ncbi:MAG: hypothetical protein KDK39_09150 [Leptospiraceae bacterium]|nr:hypothetical protein [Leptospiraceae bacterium]
MLRRIDKLWCLAQVLSLDVVLAALSLLFFVSRLLQQPLQPLYYLSLALAVWIIYIGDHFLDALHFSGQIAVPRYHFFQQHRILWFGLLMFVASALVSLVTCYLPSRLLIAGMGMAAIAATHLFIAFRWRRWPWLKELAVALIFSTGIILGPWSKFEFGFHRPILAIWLHIFLASWSNLISFAIFERSLDRRQSAWSQVLWLGLPINRCLVMILSTTNTVLCIALVFILEIQPLSTLVFLPVTFGGALLPAAMLLNYVFWKRQQRYRRFADLVFLLYILAALF